MSVAIAPRPERTRLGVALDRGDRETQEDAAGVIAGDDPAFEIHGGVLGVVCDGMGGMQHGAAASKLALAAFTAAYRKKPVSESIPDALRRAANEANAAVYSAAVDANVPGRMGCTLAAFVVRGIEFYWAYAGDSRIYHLSAGRLVQVSGDHNYGAVLDGQVARGEMLALDAANHPKREALTSHLGRVEIPILDGAASPVRLLPGDWILACSDGLYSVLADATIEQMLIGSPNAAAIALISAVRESPQGDKDNASVVVANITDRQVTVARYGTDGVGSLGDAVKSAANGFSEVQAARERIGSKYGFSWPVVSLATLSIALAGVIGWMTLNTSREPSPATTTFGTRATEPVAPSTTINTSPVLGQIYQGEALPAVGAGQPAVTATIGQRTKPPTPSPVDKRVPEPANPISGQNNTQKLSSPDSGAKVKTAPPSNTAPPVAPPAVGGTLNIDTRSSGGAQGGPSTSSETPVGSTSSELKTQPPAGSVGNAAANAVHTSGEHRPKGAEPNKEKSGSTTTPERKSTDEKGGAQ